jgi:hypothetical protein
VTWDGDKELHVWVIGEPREPRKDPPEEEPEEAADVGATITPTDFGVTGNSAGAAPSPPPTSTELPDKPLDPVARVLLGMARGVGGLALETGEFLGLTAVTFGGYATFRLYAGMWAGYHEQAADGTKMGVVGAINSLNPLYAIARGALETYRAAERGDFEAAGEKGVVTAIVTAVTVVGVVQGLSSLGGKPPYGSGAALRAGAAETGAAGATQGGSAGAMRALTFQPSPKHPPGISPRPGVSPGPIHGQEALDTSVVVGENTSRRVGIDYSTREFVVFDEHVPGVFHGHVRPWSELSTQMQNALTRAGMSNRKGKILTE